MKTEIWTKEGLYWKKHVDHWKLLGELQLKETIRGMFKTTYKKNNAKHDLVDDHVHPQNDLVGLEDRTENRS